MSDAVRTRNALLSALPLETAHYGQELEQKEIYIPRSHVKALRLESSLVVGGRGVGKSFWTAVLSKADMRKTLGVAIPDLEKTEVAKGFAASSDIAAYPDADTFSRLLEDGNVTPYDIWRAVIARWLAKRLGETIPSKEWSQTVKWVKEQPESLSKIAEKVNQSFVEKGRKGLIVFDALDRSSGDWKSMDEIVRDLLRVVLWLKSYREIHAKVFLREDQFSRTVTNFPDYSKLSATKSELIWQSHDLHGLLWQLLCNAPENGGALFREMYCRVVGKEPEKQGGAWTLAAEAKQEEVLRPMFEFLAGPWMGTNKRRGVPYLWSVRHLADGKGRTSPRSFLTAIRAAGEDSSEKHSEHSYPLHYQSIKYGVQEASKVRIDEMAEDYPWVKDFFEPLRGLVVPCEKSRVEELWGDHFKGERNPLQYVGLPPRYLEHGWPGIVENLEQLGIFEIMKDGRINMPDLYRVGFGLGRRGGVKPVK